jgi:hypothetical protein
MEGSSVSAQFSEVFAYLFEKDGWEIQIAIRHTLHPLSHENVRLSLEHGQLRANIRA